MLPTNRNILNRYAFCCHIFFVLFVLVVPASWLFERSGWDFKRLTYSWLPCVVVVVIVTRVLTVLLLFLCKQQCCFGSLYVFLVILGLR